MSQVARIDDAARATNRRNAAPAATVTRMLMHDRARRSRYGQHGLRRPRAGRAPGGPRHRVRALARAHRPRVREHGVRGRRAGRTLDRARTDGRGNARASRRYAAAQSREAASFLSVDLASIVASIDAAKRVGLANVVYVSVAQPGQVMRAYVRLRAQRSRIEAGRLTATILRPWYVLGPGSVAGRAGAAPEARQALPANPPGGAASGLRHARADDRCARGRCRRSAIAGEAANCRRYGDSRRSRAECPANLPQRPRASPRSPATRACARAL